MAEATLIAEKFDVKAALKPRARYLLRPVRLVRSYRKENFRPDIIAGLTVAVILLPQAIAFAIIAELPPEMGLYAAIVGAFVGALWGSSDQIHNGPTNAISLLVLSTLSSTAVAGTPEYIVAATMLAVMVGLFQLILGMARLGVLVNFVSHSVIVGFATGAGVLIAIKQIGPLLGLTLPREHILETVTGIVVLAPDTHIPTAALGIGTMLVIIILNYVNPKLPAALIGMVLASAVVFIFSLQNGGVSVIGELPSGFPPPTNLQSFSLSMARDLLTGAIAVGAIGLVETTAISRSISAQTGQRLDSNQEFVGQGMANFFVGLFSGYPVAGSFSRSAVNFRGGAKSPIAAILSSGFVLLALFFLGPFTAFLPRSALAGVLLVTAYRMIDRQEILRIWRGAPGDAAIMVVTFLGTLFLEIETAVLLGIALSFVLYVMRTSTPRIHAVLPDKSFRHFYYQPEREPCPQLGIIEILGGLYFGAVSHVEEFILDYNRQHPYQRFLVLRMHNVNHCDFSGIHMLESVVHTYREHGGDVFMVRVNPRVRQLMETTGFCKYLGDDHFVPEDEIIPKMFYHTLDPAVCIYECPVRVFKECQNLPKRKDYFHIQDESAAIRENVPVIASPALWEQLFNGSQERPLPIVVDVREPREYRQGHIDKAHSLPLSKLLQGEADLPSDRSLILVCRTGRRSRRAAQALQEMGRDDLQILDGGMRSWSACGLLEAIGPIESEPTEAA